MNDWKTPAWIAEHLNVSTSYVTNKIRTGEWEAIRLSERIYRFTPEQIESIENSGETTAPRRRNKPRLRAALKKLA